MTISKWIRDILTFCISVLYNIILSKYHYILNNIICILIFIIDAKNPIEYCAMMPNLQVVIYENWVDNINTASGSNLNIDASTGTSINSNINYINKNKMIDRQRSRSPPEKKLINFMGVMDDDDDDYNV